MTIAIVQTQERKFMTSFFRLTSSILIITMIMIGSAEPRERSHGLVASINAKLARWVRPTGKCGIGSREILATYYSSGRRTANGERFNKHGLTAASMTLPFGTILRIRNPHNDRSTTVRINDKGPATKAEIDLSLGAARAIGMTTSIYVCAGG